MVKLHFSEIDDNTWKLVLRYLCNILPNTATTVNKTPPLTNHDIRRAFERLPVSDITRNIFKKDNRQREDDDFPKLCIEKMGLKTFIFHQLHVQCT